MELRNLATAFNAQESLRYELIYSLHGFYVVLVTWGLLQAAGGATTFVDAQELACRSLLQRAGRRYVRDGIEMVHGSFCKYFVF